MSPFYTDGFKPLNDYDRIFEAERLVSYQTVSAFEARMGYAIDRAKLEDAARVLACPLKAHAPNWQHGRVLYAAARQYLAPPRGLVSVLDIGTAKGFSALCLRWALTDSCVPGLVVSVDVIDPKARVRRNTVAEVDGLKTLAEILAPWPESAGIHFEQANGSEVLHRSSERIHIAFIDGKHDGPVVHREGTALARRQEPGDLAIFDDTHMPAVGFAVQSLYLLYDLELLSLGVVDRQYAIGVRR